MKSKRLRVPWIIDPCGIHSWIRYILFDVFQGFGPTRKSSSAPDKMSSVEGLKVIQASVLRNLWAFGAKYIKTYTLGIV